MVATVMAATVMVATVMVATVMAATVVGSSPDTGLAVVCPLDLQRIPRFGTSISNHKRS